MILVRKSHQVPAKMAAGAPLTVEHCAAFDADPNAYLAGRSAFIFDNAVYGHTSVKAVLEAAQHGKCCYCEGHFHGHAPGDVEHYRPKKAVRQEFGSPAIHPGYYWLAYSWANLYFSCPDCNRSAKRSFFPLANPNGRARRHSDDINSERPLILDPGGPENPRQHIRFHQEVPIGVTVRGRSTIKYVRLDRGALNERRRTRLAELRRLQEVVTVCANYPDAQQLVIEARDVLEAAVRPDAIFSAMAQDLLAR